MVILDKLHHSPYRLFKDSLIKTLEEETSVITKYTWFKDEHVRNRCLNYIHLITHKL